MMKSRVVWVVAVVIGFIGGTLGLLAGDLIWRDAERTGMAVLPPEPVVAPAAMYGVPGSAVTPEESERRRMALVADVQREMRYQAAVADARRELEAAEAHDDMGCEDEDCENSWHYDLGDGPEPTWEEHLQHPTFAVTYEAFARHWHAFVTFTISAEEPEPEPYAADVLTSAWKLPAVRRAFAEIQAARAIWFYWRRHGEGQREIDMQELILSESEAIVTMMGLSEHWPAFVAADAAQDQSPPVTNSEGTDE